MCVLPHPVPLCSVPLSLHYCRIQPCRVSVESHQHHRSETKRNKLDAARAKSEKSPCSYPTPFCCLPVHAPLYLPATDRYSYSEPVAKRTWRPKRSQATRRRRLYMADAACVVMPALAFGVSSPLDDSSLPRLPPIRRLASFFSASVTSFASFRMSGPH